MRDNYIDPLWTVHLITVTLVKKSDNLVFLCSCCFPPAHSNGFSHNKWHQISVWLRSIQWEGSECFLLLFRGEKGGKKVYLLSKHGSRWIQWPLHGTKYVCYFSDPWNIEIKYIIWCKSKDELTNQSINFIDKAPFILKAVNNYL